MADQLVAVAHTDAGIVSLGQQAGLSPDETRRLVADTQAALAANGGGADPGRANTQDYGTGALRPDE
jgi:hypothetical protein